MHLLSIVIRRDDKTVSLLHAALSPEKLHRVANAWARAHGLAVFFKIVLIRLTHLVDLVVGDKLLYRCIKHCSQLELSFISDGQIFFLSDLMYILHNFDQFAIFLAAIESCDWNSIAQMRGKREYLVIDKESLREVKAA